MIESKTKESNQKQQVTVVIVSYKSRGTISASLNALQEPYEAGFLRIVVVDNDSADGTADFIAQHYPSVSLVRSQVNLGYGRGCNLGFKMVQTPYVLILNPDAVIDFKAIRKLVEFMSADEKVGVAAPAIIEGEENIQSAGLMTTPLSLLKSTCGFDSAMPQSRLVTPGGSPFKTNWVCGATMLIRSEYFRKLNGFDPRFFLYFEETDLCRRANKHGMEIWAVGEAVARHIGGASAKETGKSLVSSCIAEHYYPSRFYYLVKHFGWFLAVGTEAMVYALQKIRYWANRLSGRTSIIHDPQINNPIFRLPVQPSKDL